MEGDGFFETAMDVFDYAPQLRKATLKVEMPVTVCIDSFDCKSETWTVETKWTGFGKISKTSDRFAITDDGSYSEEERVESGSESLVRSADAEASLNGQQFNGSITENDVTFISTNSKSVTRFGDTHLVGASPIAITDCPIPRVDQGDKLVSEGKGKLAGASWNLENDHGTLTIISLGVSDGLFAVGRQCFFVENMDVFLQRVEKDKDGNTVSVESGSVRFEPSDSNPFKIDKKLRTAALSPITIEICPSEEKNEAGTCTDGEVMEVSAEWTGTGDVSIERFKFNAKTNCDDAECSTNDQEQNFKVKVVSNTKSRIAVATAVVNGIETGESDPSLIEEDPAQLQISERLIFEDGGAYPFQIFPILVFDL